MTWWRLILIPMFAGAYYLIAKVFEDFFSGHGGKPEDPAEGLRKEKESKDHNHRHSQTFRYYRNYMLPISLETHFIG